MSDTLDVSVDDETFVQVDLDEHQPIVRVQVQDDGTKLVKVNNTDGEVEATFRFDEPAEEREKRKQAEAEAQAERQAQRKFERHLDRRGNF